MLSLALALWLGQDPAPPPHVRKEPEKPKTPEIIRVGGSYNLLTDSELSHLQQRIAEDPNDICVRGMLIRRTTWVQAKNHPRTRHILWMIENHPDWEGFRFAEYLAVPRSDDEKTGFPQISEAWKRPTTIASRSGRHDLLVNAAHSLAVMDPMEAATLLLRAMELEPNSQVYPYYLGRIYGLVIDRYERGPGPHVKPWAERQLLAVTDKRILLGARAVLFRAESIAKLDALFETLATISPLGVEVWWPKQPLKVSCPAL
jgi:hypothetical protein